MICTHCLRGLLVYCLEQPFSDTVCVLLLSLTNKKQNISIVDVVVLACCAIEFCIFSCLNFDASTDSAIKHSKRNGSSNMFT